MTDETKRGTLARGKRAKENVPLLRHQARVLALQTLFEIDLTGHPIDDALANPLDVGRLDEEEAEAEGVPAEVRGHAERLVRGVRDHLAEIDPMIVEAAPAYPLAQVPAVDRNVLRLAIYELLHEPGVPPKAAINEAVELAKRFGGLHSGRFVNGVLGTVLGRIPARSAEAASRRRDRGRAPAE